MIAATHFKTLSEDKSTAHWTSNHSSEILSIAPGKHKIYSNSTQGDPIYKPEVKICIIFWKKKIEQHKVTHSVKFHELTQKYAMINLRDVNEKHVKKDLPETRKNGILEQLSTKNVAGPNAGVKRLRQKNTAWAKP